ncbi:unnamed protein product, partial [Rotaria sp. Silwood2]
MIVNKIIANNDGQIIQGVKNESWLKDLIGFHATESLPPDVMHDIAEGNTMNCYIYANPLRKSWLSYLNGLCKQFHCLMIEHLPDYVTPKAHFLMEYTRSIEMHGLPILNSGMRFEANHLYFKQIAIRTFNFKNPLLTLAKRYQLRYCMLYNSNSLCYSSSMTVQSSKLIKWSKLSIPVRRLLINLMNETDLIYECTSIYCHRMNVRTGSIVVHHIAHAEEIPVFCQIHHLLSIQEKITIIAETLNTVSFDANLWSYEIEFTGTLVTIDIEHCFDIHPHCLDVYDVEHAHYLNLLTHEDIDGSTLVLLQHNDIAEIFPRIKDRVKFIDQRTKLTSNLNEQNENTDATPATNVFDLTPSSSFKPVDSLQENDTLDSSVLRESSQSNNDIHQTTDANLSSSINFPDDNDDIYTTAKLSSDYQGPDLPIRMQHYIDDNNISKFNPHTAWRGELLSLLFDDVTKSHKLLYPTNDEYLTMAVFDKKTACSFSIKDWHESIKQKFKRERKPLQVTTNFVKSKQEKYGNGKTNGRPKRKSTILQAERRTNDIRTISMADRQNENVLSIVDQMQLELLKDDPDLDIFHNLWQQSFNIGRLCIHDLTVTEILERFPGYRLSEMNVKISYLFILDVLPIRVIRILCKFFGDPVGNVFTHGDVLVPYPCIKIHDDRFELYLNFCLITETTSCFTALALLLSLYYVFEIRFGLHNRTCRLLYGILFEDSHYLNKALKNLLHNWQYKIVNRPLMKRQAMVTNLIENSTQPSIVNKNSSSSNNSNEVVDESLEQVKQNQYSSSNFNLTRSTNIDQQSLNQHMDDDLNQASNSDDEELKPLSIASPFSMSQCSSPLIIHNQTTSSFTIEDHSNNIYSEKTREFYHSDKPLSKEQGEDEPDTYTEGKELHSAAIKRKRKKQTSSSSITTTAKHSARLV